MATVSAGKIDDKIADNLRRLIGRRTFLGALALPMRRASPKSNWSNSPIPVKGRESSWLKKSSKPMSNGASN